jgi:hypothetical protein
VNFDLICTVDASLSSYQNTPALGEGRYLIILCNYNELQIEDRKGHTNCCIFIGFPYHAVFSFTFLPKQPFPFDVSVPKGSNAHVWYRKVFFSGVNTSL